LGVVFVVQAGVMTGDDVGQIPILTENRSAVNRVRCPRRPELKVALKARLIFPEIVQ
jgi:hypothetical protein